ncbi:septal ring lytic transglycosylase RlpA family protein [Flammeovirga pectinis]|uniref:Probable endolytic peptidoglycan transglycosylase RlpA n=1 Tax=Flammeovirga pectinis TaxID=2494373 RepID=A0A3Q9FMZ7_9BACT|nr:septal ring lytic transglycosylase RlpA family protein [Flammeovirga pectinis]AZQ61984.1 septal ring lytic transglycosylase RlpA family protein [Flammeovirga pectinis]
MKFILLALLSVAFFNTTFAQTKVGDTKKGQSSYYADKFHGRKTANGERFNMYAFTCAHRKLPFDTYLKVTNLKNKKWIVVRVNDRGPFKSQRILDLSKGAAVKIDMINDGIADVEIEILYTNGQGTKVKEGTSGGPNQKITTADVKKPKKNSSTSSQPKKSSGSYGAPGTYSIWGTSKKIKNGYGIQMASYKDVKKAIDAGKLANKKGLTEIYIQAGFSNNKKIYRLLYGDFSEGNAKKNVQKVKSKGYKGAFVKKHL